MVDFQRVEKGVLLARIDNTPFREKVQQGAANTAAQRATLANSAQSLRSAQAQLESQCAIVASAQPGNQKAQADMNRIAELVDEGSVSLRERDQALAALRQAQAGVRQAQAQRAIAAENVRSVSPPISQVATYSDAGTCRSTGRASALSSDSPEALPRPSIPRQATGGSVSPHLRFSPRKAVICGFQSVSVACQAETARGNLRTTRH